MSYKSILASILAASLLAAAIAPSAHALISINGGGNNGQSAQGAVIGASGVVVHAIELPASTR